jgi:hypothetical protein
VVNRLPHAEIAHECQGTHGVGTTYHLIFHENPAR